MSSTSFTPLSPLANKLWARKAFLDSVKPTLMGKLTGKSDRAIIQVRDEIKSEGDRIRFRIRALPTGVGVQDAEVLEGTEEGLDYKHFDINLGEKRKAFKVELNLSEQRTMAPVRQDLYSAMTEWTEEYLDTTFFEYASGTPYGPVGTTFANLAGGVSRYHPTGVLGGNAIQAPSTDRILYGGTGVTSAAGLAVGDTFQLQILDRLAERLQRANPTVRKGNFDGKAQWIVVLSPEQITSLRTNVNAGQWLDIQKAAMAGGKVSDNPIWSEALGVYRDFMLISSTRVARFNNGGGGGNVEYHRALVLGAQSLVVSHGVDTDGMGKLKMVEKEIDYGKHLGVGATFVWGMQKTRFADQSDYGIFCIDTAARPAT